MESSGAGSPLRLFPRKLTGRTALRATSESLGLNVAFSPKNGSVRTLLIAWLASAIVVAALAWLALQLQATSGIAESPVINIYCAAAVAQPLEEIVAEYNAAAANQSLTLVIARIGGSGELTGQLRAEAEIGLGLGRTQGGDILVSADEDLIAQAVDAGVIGETLSIARQRPVIAVRLESQPQIGSLAELARAGLRYGIGSKQASIGRLTRSLAAAEQVLGELESSKSLDGENVMTLGQALVSGSIDAAVIWDSTVTQINRKSESRQLKIIALADVRGITESSISAGAVLRSSSTPERDLAIKQFLRYLAQSQAARRQLAEFGLSR